MPLQQCARQRASAFARPGHRNSYQSGVIIGTLRGVYVGGRRVGDYTSLNRLSSVLIIGTKAPYPPYSPRGPYDVIWCNIGAFRIQAFREAPQCNVVTLNSTPK